jgi:hypothetical protein
MNLDLLTNATVVEYAMKFVCCTNKGEAIGMFTELVKAVLGG